MLEINFTEKYIRDLQSVYKICEPGILEKTIHALALLESLAKTKLKFIFKGGTSLILLMEEPKRLSVDIDIIVDKETEITPCLDNIKNKNGFIYYVEDFRKNDKAIIKKHYKFFYKSTINPKTRSNYILLDVLFEDSNYEDTISKTIDNKLIRNKERMPTVIIPDKESLLGDKFTAFAPHTCGVLLGGEKDLEVMKQFFDIKTLIYVIEDFNKVKKTYLRVVKQEIAYRGNIFTHLQCLTDTLEAAICIVGGEKINKEEFNKYKDAIDRLKNHIFDEKYSIETAQQDACLVIYATCCLLYNEEFERDIEIKGVESYKIKNEKLKDLEYIKKVNIKSYKYLVQSDQIMNKHN